MLCFEFTEPLRMHKCQVLSTGLPSEKRFEFNLLFSLRLQYPEIELVQIRDCIAPALGMRKIVLSRYTDCHQATGRGTFETHLIGNRSLCENTAHWL